jgi:hypothetical protein
VVCTTAILFAIPDLVPSASAATVVHRNRYGGATAVQTRPAPRRAVVVAPVRPIPAVRPWYWGRVVAGVTIGTIIVASAVAVAPKPPSPELCWYWSDNTKTRGYWNYCVAPTQ